MDSRQPKLGLSDLIDQDITCYEYYKSLPSEIRREIENADVEDFEEMQQVVSNYKNEHEVEGDYNEQL